MSSIPSLSTKGRLFLPHDLADHQMACFLVSQSKQSSRCRAGAVVSLPALLQKFGKDKALLEQNIRSGLYQLFTDIADTAVVSVTVLPEDTDSSKLAITVGVQFTIDGKTYDCGRLINSINSTVVKIMQINNGG